MKKITILGSTGSIGINTLNVVRLHSDQFQVFALTAHSQVDLIFNQILEFKPQYAVLVDHNAATVLSDLVKKYDLATVVLSGVTALNDVSSHQEVDMVMAAIVGAAGLLPCISAAKAGKKILLANKETLVLGGDLFINIVKSSGASLIPIDSEHSAIFQSLPDDPTIWSSQIKRLILTASGGPFRKREITTFSTITPEQACAHPNWKMGRKISIDSATMMNKALEVIEAKFLFTVTPEQIDVVIHPQSVIHSMVEYTDGSVIAQLGTTDMRVPISYGLSWPNRMESGARSIDFSQLSALTFEPPDQRRFPGLFLSWHALKLPFGSTGVLNAANEIAVQAFIEQKIRFDQIFSVNSEVLSGFIIQAVSSVEDLIEMDYSARKYTLSIVDKFKAN